MDFDTLPSISSFISPPRVVDRILQFVNFPWRTHVAHTLFLFIPLSKCYRRYSSFLPSTNQLSKRATILPTFFFPLPLPLHESADVTAILFLLPTLTPTHELAIFSYTPLAVTTTYGNVQGLVAGGRCAGRPQCSADCTALTSGVSSVV